MGSVQLPLNIPLMEEGSHASSNLIHEGSIYFVKNEKKEEDRNGNLIDKLWT